jgi:hypothetical protein
VKKYKPGQLVTAHDIRAMLGMLEIDKNVAKGIVTATSDFAKIMEFMPYRLELRAQDDLLELLRSICRCIEAAALNPSSGALWQLGVLSGAL